MCHPLPTQAIVCGPKDLVCVAIPFPKNCADFEIWTMRHAVHHSMILSRFLRHTDALGACFSSIQHTNERYIRPISVAVAVQHAPGRIPLRPTTPDKGKHSTTRAHLCMHAGQKEARRRGEKKNTFVVYTQGDMHQPHTHTHTSSPRATHGPPPHAGELGSTPPFARRRTKRELQHPGFPRGPPPQY